MLSFFVDVFFFFGLLFFFISLLRLYCRSVCSPLEISSALFVLSDEALFCLQFTQNVILLHVS